MSIWDKQVIELQEQVYVVFLNGNNEVIAWRNINTGTDNKSLFDIKIALCLALNCMSSYMIIAHNHPYGYVNPSPADITITQRLKSACNIIDIQLLDHIIVNQFNFFSFLDNGMM